MRLIRLLPCVALAACTQFPELESVEGAHVKDTAYPALLTVAELNAIPESTATIELQGAVLDRLSALQARAARLRRRPVIDRQTKTRMARGVR